MEKLAIALGFIGALIFLGGCQATQANNQKTDPKEITIYIARHGKTMLYTTDKSQGWIDAPLTPAGTTIAENLGKGLKNIKFDSVYSSDSGRAIETASLILKNNGQTNLVDKIKKEKRLREFNFGTFEGIPNQEMWSAVAEDQGLTLKQWQSNMEKNGVINSIKDFANALNRLDKERLDH